MLEISCFHSMPWLTRLLRAGIIQSLFGGSAPSPVPQRPLAGTLTTEAQDAVLGDLSFLAGGHHSHAVSLQHRLLKGFAAL